MEITKSKEMIEDIIGLEVVSFSAVGGHYNRWMREEAQTAGYKAFGTMAPGKTYVKGTPALLRRNHIQAHYREADISRLLDQKLLTMVWSSMRYHFLQTPKTALGLRNYDRLKSLLLSVKPSASSG